MLTEHENTVLFHLGYEWWMFCAADDLLQALPDKDDPVRNALIESLAMHGRNLVWFFFKRRQDRYSTDWNATDLGLARQKEPPELEAWRRDANERLAHLTATRETPSTGWDTPTARRLIKERVDHVKNVLGQDVPPDWPGDLPTTSNLLNPGVLSSPARGPTSTDAVTGLSGVLKTTGPADPKRRPRYL